MVIGLILCTNKVILNPVNTGDNHKIGMYSLQKVICPSTTVRRTVTIITNDSNSQTNKYDQNTGMPCCAVQYKASPPISLKNFSASESLRLLFPIHLPQANSQCIVYLLTLHPSLGQDLVHLYPSHIPVQRKYIFDW